MGNCTWSIHCLRFGCVEVEEISPTPLPSRLSSNPCRIRIAGDTVFTQDRLQALADDTHRRTASPQRDSLRSSFQW